MRITNKLLVRQYVAKSAFFFNKFHLRGFVFMKAISVEGFLMKQALNRLFLTIG